MPMPPDCPTKLSRSNCNTDPSSLNSQEFSRRPSRRHHLKFCNFSYGVETASGTNGLPSANRWFVRRNRGVSSLPALPRQSGESPKTERNSLRQSHLTRLETRKNTSIRVKCQPAAEASRRPGNRKNRASCFVAEFAGTSPFQGLGILAISAAESGLGILANSVTELVGIVGNSAAAGRSLNHAARDRRMDVCPSAIALLPSQEIHAAQAPDP